MKSIVMQRRGWIGVDLDGTLALYDRWRGIEHVGDFCLTPRNGALEIINDPS